MTNIRKAIVAIHLHAASIASGPRSVAVSLPREPWDGDARRVSLPGDRPSAARLTDDPMPSGAARVSMVKRIIREVAMTPVDHGPREVVL